MFGEVLVEIVDGFLGDFDGVWETCWSSLLMVWYGDDGGVWRIVEVFVGIMIGFGEFLVTHPAARTWSHFCGPVWALLVARSILSLS